MPPRMKIFRSGSLAYAAALALALAAGAWLRFSGLGSQGLCMWDEAYYGLQARTCAGAARWVLRQTGPGPRPALAELKAELRAQGGTLPDTAAKPSYLALVTGSVLALGGGDRAILGLSAFCGLLSIVLVYLLGSLWAGPAAGLASAALLAGLGAHVWQSRVGLAITPSSLLLLAGAWFWARDLEGRPSRLLSAGFLLGLAFSASYNTLPSIGLLFLAAAGRRRWRGLIWLALGAALPLLGWELFFRLRNHFSPIPMLSYFGELGRQIFHNAKAQGPASWHASLFPRWFALSSGLWPCGLLGLGLVLGGALPEGRRGGPAAAAVWLLGPAMLAFWFVALRWYAPVARPLGAVLPFLCLASGRGWAVLVERLEARGWTSWSCAGLLTAVLLLPGCALSLPLARWRSPYPAAADFLESRSGTVFTCSGGLLQFYRPALVPRLSSSEPAKAFAPGVPPPELILADYALPHNIPGVAQAPWMRAALERPPLWSASFAPLDARLVFMEADSSGIEGSGPAFEEGVKVYELAVRR